MKRLCNAAYILIFLLAAVPAAAQPRGEGRIAGKVSDEQGQPIQDVQVKATMAGESLPLQTKTNKKGEWVISGMAGGRYVIEFAKEGFEPFSSKVDVDESAPLPSITVRLAKPVPKVDPNAELQAETLKANALLQQGKAADARKILQDLLVKYPTVHALHAFIGQTYTVEKNYDKALEEVRIAAEKDPTNAEIKLQLADLLIETGKKDDAIQIIQTIDLTQVKNPLPIVNAAIVLINESKTDQALELLNKVQQQFPTVPETYYYRGRAYVAAKKMTEAKADLEKFVSIAPPDAPQLPDAKKILEQLKDIK